MKPEDRPIWIEVSDDKKKQKEIEGEIRNKLIEFYYKKNEICIFFDLDKLAIQNKTLDQRIKELIKSFDENKSDDFDPSNIEVVRCDNCNIPIVLFRAPNIDRFVLLSGVREGAPPASGSVGEEYSLNFYNSLPFEKKEKSVEYIGELDSFIEKENNIVVAVLDTGIDTKLVNPKYIWQETENTTNLDCYRTVTTGWNFIDQSSNVDDDDPLKHGSIVSQYIINEFRNSSRNNVKIMPLKTHDKHGKGDLFTIICAIYFAIIKGANMINASWGFYYYFETPIPYLDALITKQLKRQNILFITAAGNQDKEEEKIARDIYTKRYNPLQITDQQLRDIAIHNFYPAHLSRDTNNVITVTTTDEKTVSKTQNYSNIFADLGVMADTDMKFKVPFSHMAQSDPISGSSFATAIATGVIGANINSTAISKQDLLKIDIGTINNGIPQPVFSCFSINENLKGNIKEGLVIDRNKVPNT